MRRTAMTVGLLLALPLAALAEEPAARLSEKLNPKQPGYSEYQQYCAVCHGVFADGNGLVVPVLTTKPTDLRHLGARYGTPLSTQKLVRTIDGSDPILAHGSREMPIWGDRYQAQVGLKYGPYGSETVVRARILELVYYLQSVQQ